MQSALMPSPWAYFSLVSVVATFASIVLPRAQREGECPLPDWPAVATVAAWPFLGARERCFCAYSTQSLDVRDSLTAACPTWRDWVTTDGETPNRVSHHGAHATVLGGTDGNVSSSRYAFVGDWAVDLGSGYGAECDRARTADCMAIGAHVLTVPRDRYLHDCCGKHSSLGALLLSEPRAVCSLLRGLVAGGLSRVPQLQKYESCRHQGQEPTAESGCLAQCFHIIPDVFYLHLHTTAGGARAACLTRLRQPSHGLLSQPRASPWSEPRLA